MRAEQKAVIPETPCHRDVLHIQHQFEQVANGLARQAQGATTRRIKLEQQIAKARLTHRVTRKMTSLLVHAKRLEQELISLTTDIKTLLRWMSHDVLELAGLSLVVRQELFDFIETELQQRESQHMLSAKYCLICWKTQNCVLAMKISWGFVVGSAAESVFWKLTYISPTASSAAPHHS